MAYTWMCAETSKINIIPNTDNKSSCDGSQEVDYEDAPAEQIYMGVNFGLTKRPETKLVLEKHITGLKITPNGVGVQPIIDAKADINQIINAEDGKIEIPKDKNKREGLKTMIANRNERGFWNVELEEELKQGTELVVDYTYVVKNESDEDYLSNTLVQKYKTDPNNYGAYLDNVAQNLKNSKKGKTNEYGDYLGQWYYDGTNADPELLVPSRVETNGIQEALNNQLKYAEKSNNAFESFQRDEDKIDFASVYSWNVSDTIFDEDGNEATEKRETVVRSAQPTSFLTRNTFNNGKWEKWTSETADFSKTLTLKRVLSSVSEREEEYPSYLAEIVKYSNAAGRRNMNAEPANLTYVHSKDKDMTMNSTTVRNTAGDVVERANDLEQDDTIIRPANEEDEFWGESITITTRTGKDMQFPMKMIIVGLSSFAIIGLGILLIKKFALKK